MGKETWGRQIKLFNKSRSKEEEVCIQTESNGILLIKWTQGHTQSHNQDSHN